MEKVTERLTRSWIVHPGYVHEKLSEILIDAFDALSVYTFVSKLYHLCMIWQVTSLPN
jgi:hypothetical protein